MGLEWDSGTDGIMRAWYNRIFVHCITRAVYVRADKIEGWDGWIVPTADK